MRNVKSVESFGKSILVSFKISTTTEGILRNFVKFTEKHLCQSLFFNKVLGLSLQLWHRCFPMNFAKFLRTPFLQNTSGRLLLYVNNVKPRVRSSHWRCFIKTDALKIFAKLTRKHLCQSLFLIKLHVSAPPRGLRTTPVVCF